MKNAYLAICYICNENCRFCPCSKSDKSSGIITNINELTQCVNKINDDGVTDITISGGEPTLHPDFIDIISYIQHKGINVTVLSNSEKFADIEFLKDFLEKVNINNIKVITTLHSNSSYEHEDTNRTKGSFYRTVNGLLGLSKNGVKVIIKHCITKVNYKGLLDFYEFCDKTFDSKVDIQLCSIDYCGIPKEQLQKERLSFPELRPYLEDLFEYHISQKNKGNNRYLYCINMPLCSCDVIYWNYFNGKRKKMYDAYKDPCIKNMKKVSDNVGISQKYCNKCRVSSICSGTYFTAFDAFGSSIIKPFL